MNDMPPNTGLDEPQHRPTAKEFVTRFTSSPRGARLARRLVSRRLHAWGHPYDSSTNRDLTAIAAELTANAVRHGHVPGRGFHLRLTTSDETPPSLRIELTDTRTDRLPHLVPAPDGESGRGLFLVAALADDWGVFPRENGPGKTVWAQLAPPRDRAELWSPASEFTGVQGDMVEGR